MKPDDFKVGPDVAGAVVPGLRVSQARHLVTSAGLRMKHPPHSQDPSLGLNWSNSDFISVSGLATSLGFSFVWASSKIFLNFCACSNVLNLRANISCVLSPSEKSCAVQVHVRSEVCSGFNASEAVMTWLQQTLRTCSRLIKSLLRPVVLCSRIFISPRPFSFHSFVSATKR